MTVPAAAPAADPIVSTNVEAPSTACASTPLPLARRAWPRWPWAVLVTALAVLLGCGALVWTTRWGAGLTGDSHAYLASARNVQLGNWVTFEDYSIAADPKPLEQFPVGYPLLLAAGRMFGADPATAARWLNVAGMGLMLSLFGWLLWVNTRSLLVLALALATFALSPATQRNYAFAMTEGLFVTCAAVLLAGLIAAQRNLDIRWRRTALLCVAAAAAGWSCTLRYAGVFQVAVGVAAILLWPAGERFTLRHRVMGAALFLLVASLLPMAQATFNLWVIGRPTSRPLAFHPPPWAKFDQLIYSIGLWLFPFLPTRFGDGLTRTIGGAALVALTLVPPVLAIVRYRRRGAGPSAWATTTWMLAAGYAPFIVTAYTFQDANIPFNTRIFFPLWFGGWLFAAGIIGRTAWSMPRRKLRRATVAILALAACGPLLSTTWIQAEDLPGRRNIGFGFEGPRWHRNRILETIRSDHSSVAGKPLVGNGGDLVGMTTHRRMAHVPKWFSRPRGAPYRKMPQQYRQFARWAMSAEARVVYFNDLKDRYDFLSSEAMLAEYMHLRPLVTKREGTIYEVLAVKGFEDQDYDDDGRPDWENLEVPARGEVILRLGVLPASAPSP